MQDLKELFGLWPSIRSMADAIGEKPNTVSRWHQRMRIPESAWQKVIAGAAFSGHLISANDLMRLNRPTKKRGAGSPKHKYSPNYEGSAV